MSIRLEQLTLAVLLMLTAPNLLCMASDEVEFNSEVSDCQPEIPPLTNPNASMVALQMHQWTWIENLTSPDWAPRTDSGSMVYEFLRPGIVRNKTLMLLGTRQSPYFFIDVSYVTNGDTLCAAALTQYRNRTSGDLDSVSCSRICHDNFTSLGTRANLPLMVYDDWKLMSQYNEYLAFDAVDPDSRASYTCMGLFKYEKMDFLPILMSRRRQCPAGDQCLFNYDNKYRLADGGCMSDFAEYSFCVTDLDLCSFNIEGNCPVCCRGDLCNLKVAQKAYKRWAETQTSTTIIPRATSTTRGASCTASSLWMLGVSAISFILLLQFRG